MVYLNNDLLNPFFLHHEHKFWSDNRFWLFTQKPQHFTTKTSFKKTNEQKDKRIRVFSTKSLILYFISFISTNIIVSYYQVSPSNLYRHFKSSVLCLIIFINSMRNYHLQKCRIIHCTRVRDTYWRDLGYDYSATKMVSLEK